MVYYFYLFTYYVHILHNLDFCYKAFSIAGVRLTQLTQTQMVKKFVAQSASESEEERERERDEVEEKLIFPKNENKNKNKNKNKNEVFDSSEEDEEDEEMTKEDLEFLKEGPEEDDTTGSDSDSISSVEESPEELSEDDLELIEENLGKRRSLSFKDSVSTKNSIKEQNKFKRLRRRNEVESSEEEESDSEESKNLNDNKKKSSELQNLFNEDDDEFEEEQDDDLHDFIEEEEQEDEDDLPENIEAAMKKKKITKTSGIPRRRAIVDDREAPKRALSSALASGQISKQAWDEMMEIFGDGTDYLDLVNESDDEETKSLANQNNDINEFENTERLAALEVSYKDIPERLSEIKIKIIDEDVNFETFLQKEATFIARKIQKLRPTDSFSGLTSAIISVLRFIHQHGLEVPFIATYRKEYFLQFFGMNELWTILDEDFKYRQINQIKGRINEKLKEIEGHVEMETSDLEYFKEALEEELEESQLQLIQEFLVKERHRKTQTLKVNHKSAILLEFAHKIVPCASRFAENIAKKRIIHGPLIMSERQLESEAVEVMARDAAISLETALSGAIHVAAEEFGSHPRLFAQIRDLLMSQAILTVSPTPLGSIEISHDPTHYLGPLQFITRKPISAFVEDQGLILSRGLEAKLISIEIEYNADELLASLKQFLPGLENFKAEVFDVAWENYWRPRLNRLVLQHLRLEAENWTAHFAQFYLQDELMTVPLDLACGSRDEDECAVTSVSITKNSTYLVELDRNGRVLRQELIKSTVRSALNPRSVFTIISGEGQECLELYRDLREFRSINKSSVLWGFDDTARIYRNSMRAAREFPECASELKYAVGVGRRMLNPVGEFAALSEDELLQLSLHPLQSHLPRGLRLKHLQRALVNVINLLGVSVNDYVLPGMKQAMLSYVSGLGPQKAAQLAKKLGNKLLLSRAELITQYDMGRRTFTNCAGFIKITSERIKGGSKKKTSTVITLDEPLDGTRIHPESYDLARKMAADALELDDPTTLQRRQDIFGDDEDIQNENDRTASILSRAILQIMKEPKKLDDLLLEEYAREIERLRHLPKHLTLFDIKAELQGPFPDPRAQQLREESIPSAPINLVVRMLTGKEENWWWKGRAVQVKLLSPVTRKLASLIDGNGLIVGIDSQDSIPRAIRVGTPVTAYLSRIDFNRLLIDVGLRRPEGHEKLMMQCIRFDPFYDFHRASNRTAAAVLQQNDRQEAQITKNGNFIANTRQLSHPAFKLVNREESENLLSSAPIGEFLIRPSSQKRLNGELPGDLTLTWKSGPGLYSHVPLGEMDRLNGQDWALGRTLLLPALIPGSDGRMKIDRFEDLDEIVGRRIEPVISLLQEAQGCPKFFFDHTSDAINNHLKNQATINPGRIPYCITMATSPHCGHLLLSHPGGLRQELIRVDPRGYALTDPKSGEIKIFERIEKLVDYFKKHYKNFSEHSKKKEVIPETLAKPATIKSKDENNRFKVVKLI